MKFEIGDRVRQTDAVAVIERFRLHTGTVVDFRFGSPVVQFDDIENPDGYNGWRTEAEFLEPAPPLYDNVDSKELRDFIDEF